MAGQPYGSVKFQYAFQVRRDEKVPPIKLYSMRHTCATAMLGMGVPIPDVAYILEHKDASTTMRVYARWLKSHRRLAAEKMATRAPWIGPEEQPEGRSATNGAVLNSGAEYIGYSQAQVAALRERGVV